MAAAFPANKVSVACDGRHAVHCEFLTLAPVPTCDIPLAGVAQRDIRSLEVTSIPCSVRLSWLENAYSHT